MQNHQQPILECQKQIKHESDIVMISGFLHFRRDFILLHSLSHKPLAYQDYPIVGQLDSKKRNTWQDGSFPAKGANPGPSVCFFLQQPMDDMLIFDIQSDWIFDNDAVENIMKYIVTINNYIFVISAKLRKSILMMGPCWPGRNVAKDQITTGCLLAPQEVEWRLGSVGFHHPVHSMVNLSSWNSTADSLTPKKQNLIDMLWM